MFSDDLIRTIGDDDDVPEELDSASDNEAVSLFTHHCHALTLYK